MPYRVVGQAVTDFIAARISFWIAPIPTMLQNVRQGQLRPLAVAGDARSDDLPGIPTVKETGIGDFDASTTYAVFAPAGTAKGSHRPARCRDQTRARRRRRAAEAACQAGVLPGIGSPEDIAQMLELRIPQWADVINSAGIKIN